MKRERFVTISVRSAHQQLHAGLITFRFRGYGLVLGLRHRIFRLQGLSPILSSQSQRSVGGDPFIYRNSLQVVVT